MSDYQDMSKSFKKNHHFTNKLLRNQVISVLIILNEKKCVNL